LHLPQIKEDTQSVQETKARDRESETETESDKWEARVKLFEQVT